MKIYAQEIVKDSYNGASKISSLHLQQEIN